MGLKNKILFVFFLFFFVSFVSSLSVELPKGSYEKGEFMDLNGSSTGKINFLVYALPGNKTVLNAVIEPDEKGFFSFKHFISCNDPSGDWVVLVKDQEEEKELRFRVNSSVKCEYLRVDFISPASSSYFRTQSFDVRVKVTDAGISVNNATVYFWDFNGNKIRMYFEGNGIYYYENINIPVDAAIEKKGLMVTALSGTKEKNGGSNIVSFNVRLVPIKIQLIKPLINEFNFGSPLILEVKPIYSDNVSVPDAKVWVEYNNEKFNLQKNESGNYFIVISTEDLNAEIFYVNVLAEDQYFNSGNLALSLEPKGHLYYFIAQNAIVYIFPVIFIFYVIFVSFKEGKTFVRRIFYKRERKKLLILMKKLQDDYFNKQIISRDVYLEQYENYNRELDKLENRMTELKNKQELS